MPKIVDHKAQRASLVERAIPMFREFGYHGLGMRKIANELGVSKSSLYHYFPSKEALFAACSKRISVPEIDLPEDPSATERFDALIAVLGALDDDFRGELSLLLDYTRGMSREEVAEDALMQEALAGFGEAMVLIVGEEKAERALQRSLGLLMLRAFGADASFESLRELCERDAT